MQEVVVHQVVLKQAANEAATEVLKNVGVDVVGDVCRYLGADPKPLSMDKLRELAAWLNFVLN